MVAPRNDRTARRVLAGRARRKVAALAAHYRALEERGEWPGDADLERSAIMGQWVAFAVKSGRDPEAIICELHDAGYLDEGADTRPATYPALMAAWSRRRKE